VNSAELYRVPGLEKMSKRFRGRLIAIAIELGLDPTAIAAVLKLESNFNPSIVNELGYVGLLQFSPDLQKRWGFDQQSFRALSAEQQLEYVRRYFMPYRKGIRYTGDHYLAAFLPAYLGKPPDFVLARKGSPVYRWNRRMFDLDEDGEITVGEVYERHARVYNQALERGAFTFREYEWDPPPAESTSSQGAGLELGPLVFVGGIALAAWAFSRKRGERSGNQRTRKTRKR
jgi:hypothetical protein